ncbi:glycosyltransferase [Roseinatronobacter monicus]|uniref:Glycosyl transferase family 4 n=1 Tax=Roseinatronobacter monicus TaxID=393481 RepID=A0A543K5I6_9RHOB|nr:glycosyltransferase [Roseinatronobacter monicus]TQM90336.1 glycosyl transferase family 4 [Roseinatronobacter monicus]
MSEPKRILAFVPNGASTDNRVVREAESLKAAGHDVLLVGLRLPNLPGSEAFSPKGVRIQRIDWQYRAFSQIAMVYAAILLPLLAIVTLVAVALGWYVYNGLLAPLAGALFNAASDLLRLLGNWFHGLISSSQALLFATGYSIEDIAAAHPMAYHVVVVIILYLIYLVLRRPFNRFGSAIGHLYKQVINNPAISVVRQKVRYARNYGENENVQQYTLLESLLAPTNTAQGGFHERISHHFVAKSRINGFVETGRVFRPDIIHCHEIGPLPAAIALKKELGCKVIYEAHEIYDDLANASLRMSAAHQAIHKECLPHVDGFVTVNEAIADYYARTYPALPSPVVMPNSVYPKSVTYDGRLHEAAKLPPEAKIILYQGGFSPHRGLPILLEAAFSLPEDWYVVFMGRGPLEDQLRDAAIAFQAETLTRLRNGLTLEALAGNDDFERLTALAQVSVGENGTPVMREVPLEEFALSRALGAMTEEDTIKETIGKTVAELRDAEYQISAERKIRRVIDGVRFSRKFEKARFVPMAPHSELVEWTSGGTIGIIPYENIGLNHWHCSPNKIWEYPNAGVPILASRLNYLTQTIQKWNIGWTLASDPTVAEIVAAVRAITDEELEEKRAACKRFIESDNYTLHEKRLLTLVDEVAA